MKLLTPMARTLPSLEQRLEGAVGLQGLVEVRGQRLVQDQQVDLVDAELGGALLEAVQRLVVAVVADPDLGLDEDLVAGQAGAVDGLADLALVAVRRGGVDVPVAGRERRLDGCAGLVGRGLEDPEPEGGHLDAVVQGQLHHVLRHVIDGRQAGSVLGGTGVTPLVGMVGGEVGEQDRHDRPAGRGR